MENSPVVTVNNGEDGAAPSVAGNPKTVRFQCGLLRETETFAEEDLQDVSLAALLEYVDEMLNIKFPEHPYGDLGEKLLLFRHTPNNSLVPLRDKENIRDGDIIEIVLSADSKQEFDDTICPHILTVNTYTGGIFCDYCGELLFGLLKQGLKCQGCDKNFHKKCAYHIPNNCTRLRTAEGMANSVTPRPPQQVWSGRPLWIDRTLKARPQVPHTFFSLTCKKPTACSHCKKMLKGVFRQGLKCKDCKIVIHKRCARELGNNCLGEVPSLSRVDSGEWSNATRGVIANEHLLSSEEISSLSTGSVGGASVGSDGTREGAGSGEPGEQREESPASARQEQDHYEPPVSPSDFPVSTMDAIAEEPSGEDTTSNEGSEHNVAEPHDSSDNIKLQRVTGVSFRHTKAPPASILKEGWMVHYTNKSDMRMKFYWRLDTKCLTLYKSDTGSHYHREIALADMLAVDQMVTPELYPLTPPHVFEIVTSAMTYYVGVDMTGALSSDLKPSGPTDSGAINLLGDVSHMTLPELEDMGMGLNVGVQWEEALHAALMPVTPQCSMGSLAEIGRGPSFRNRRGSMKGSLRGSFHGNRGNSFRGGSIRGRRGSKRGSFRVPKPGMNPGKVSPSNLIKPKVETRLDISLFYQVFPEEILGSGQFGTVYGGQNRHTAKPVAVKIIDKLRFPHKHESQLRTEVTILQNLGHPGIIHLEHMFDTPERIYVVMEKMNGDMLEMILSSPNSKLDERITKFMIYQILTALQYLHKKDVVHCDLKPENVLLTSENGMPQTKLCDFGFARMIGEKSFRKSIVGTPAYLGETAAIRQCALTL
ncbi:Serine/threonine-protein kinase D3 [Geodia barretti]|uniref:protein kinase C n=1 Tax=Geodia barretti TaxID=519541 RepID=A0AA35TLW1_GEOBA|nr:Serine/threonine-protein kinase D3 [Geodia barretti]